MMDFLSKLFGGGSGGGDMGGIFNTLVAGATGGFKDRPQWRDLEFMNDATNRLWPDEIKRQGDFLTGLAPSQASAYNTYQDSTYAQDTARQTDRIKSMSSSLGMSPWEITGAGGANPLPSPGGAGQQQGSSRMPEFLQAIVPLQVAKQSNRTQLQIAKLNADTQRYAIDQQQGQSPMAKASIAATGAITELHQVQKGQTIAQTAAIKNETFLSNLRLAIELLPNFTTSANLGAGSVNMTGKSNTFPILNALRTANTGDSLNNEQIWEMVKGFDYNRTQQLINELDALAKAGGKLAGDAAKGVTNFLGSLNPFQ